MLIYKSMKKDLTIVKTLQINGFSNIDIDQILNYLDTLEYELDNTLYVGQIVAKNE